VDALDDSQRLAADVAAGLRHWLAAIERGEMTAPKSMVYRLEGAVMALDGIAEGRPPDPSAFGSGPATS
jgi:hypothetical protein